MSDNSEQTGNYQPPTSPTTGDDGYVAPGSIAPPKDPKIDAPQTKVSASDIRSQIAGQLDWIANLTDWDKGNFTQQTVSICRRTWPEFNWILCHSSHSYVWTGNRGTDWEHWHYELDTYGIGTYGYEVYWQKGGTFSRNGDGGFENWAYIGNVQQLNDAKTILLFSAP